MNFHFWVNCPCVGYSFLLSLPHFQLQAHQSQYGSRCHNTSQKTGDVNPAMEASTSGVCFVLTVGSETLRLAMLH